MVDGDSVEALAEGNHAADAAVFPERVFHSPDDFGANGIEGGDIAGGAAPNGAGDVDQAVGGGGVPDPLFVAEEIDVGREFVGGGIEEGKRAASGVGTGADDDDLV